MMDAFATLGLPRLAALDEEAVRSAYFEKAKQTPADGTEIHAAYDTLLAPEKRLKHLLELAAPAEAKQWRTVQMSEALMQHFMALGRVRPEAEALIDKRAKAQSALTRALLERQTYALRDSFEQIGFALDEQRTALLGTLPALDTQLKTDAADTTAWRALAEAQAHLSYLAKWQAQVRELLLKLM